MIGTRALASTAGSVLILAWLLGEGGPDPSAARHAEALIRERAAAAVDALDVLSAALEPALEAARAGSALAVQGDQAPGPLLEAAADGVEGATDEADAARRAVSALEGALRTRDTDAAALPTIVSTEELGAIAAELHATGPGADAVVEMRQRASSVLDSIDRSLAALVDGRYQAARGEVEAARAEHDALVAAGGTSDALPVWLEATNAMIIVVTALIDATESGDREAAAAAADEFAELAADASMADRALQIAISEGADAATRPSVARLGAAVASIEELRAMVESVVARP